MKRAAWNGFIARAVGAGLLPPDAVAPAPVQGRPWPVIVLTGLGAWLAVLPLLGAALLLLYPTLRGDGIYVVAVVALPCALWILRRPVLSVFKEQLAFPLLLVGLAALAFGLFQDQSTANASIGLALFFLATAWLAPQAWLRQLLGAGAGWLVAQACGYEALFGMWGAWHISLALWLLGHALRRSRLNDGRSAPAAALLEALLSGWGLVMLFGLAMSSGRTFLFGGTLASGLIDSFGGRYHGDDMPAMYLLKGAVSAALTLAAGAWGMRTWPGLRAQWRSLGVLTLVLALLAWHMPALGASLLMLVFCICGGRILTATAAAVAAAWIIGAFYYAMDWALADKAMLLVGAGALFGAMAWWSLRAPPPPPQQQPAGDLPDAAAAVAVPAPEPAHEPAHEPAAPAWLDLRQRRAAIALCGVLVLGVVNVGIWRKEAVIAHGQTIYVALAPVDPRSMMQGDYMRLNFDDGWLRSLPRKTAPGARLQMVAQRHARDIATLVRIDNGEPLVAGELLVDLTLGSNGWMLVSDAWYFKEGEGERWSKARYGEFRVAPDGSATLVDLRGAELEKL